MDWRLIREILDLASRHDLVSLQFRKHDIEVSFERATGGGLDAGISGVPAAATHATRAENSIPENQNTSRTVKASMSGVVHLAPAPGEASFVKIGDRVEKGQQIAIMEAMKTFSAVKAPIKGRVEGIFVNGGDEVVSGTEMLIISAGDEEGTHV